MNKLPAPVRDDAAAFESLANNQRLKSFPRLQPIVAEVQEGYVQYARVGGHPAHVHKHTLGDALNAYLKQHYASPPADIGYIKAMRRSTAHRGCPMCGSMHSGTLDHYLPKHSYPAFSLFSLNLVPACLCNSKRGNALMGQNHDERVLHPYYDDCLEERLIRAKFEDLGEVPRVSVVLAITHTHPSYAAISFHFQEIVQKTAIRGYMADQWSSFVRKPSLVIRALGENFDSLAELRRALEDELAKLDDLYCGKNSWPSIFVTGLLDPTVLGWLLEQLSSAGRVPDAPLVQWGGPGEVNNVT